jgi:hypothetical protein
LGGVFSASISISCGWTLGTSKFSKCPHRRTCARRVPVRVCVFSSYWRSFAKKHYSLIFSSFSFC